MVEQGPLVEFGVVGVGQQGEQPASQFEHVVDVARFGRAAVHAVVQPVGLAEVLVLAVAAGGEAVMVYDPVPEEAGRQDVARVARVGKAVGGPDELGHLRVAVLAGQDVLVAPQRPDDRAMFETVGEVQPAPVVRVGVQVGQHFVHAAELGIEHLLDLGVRQTAKAPPRPTRRT